MNLTFTAASGTPNPAVLLAAVRAPGLLRVLAAEWVAVAPRRSGQDVWRVLAAGAGKATVGTRPLPAASLRFPGRIRPPRPVPRSVRVSPLIARHSFFALARLAKIRSPQPRTALPPALRLPVRPATLALSPAAEARLQSAVRRVLTGKPKA